MLKILGCTPAIHRLEEVLVLLAHAPLRRLEGARVEERCRHNVPFDGGR